MGTTRRFSRNIDRLSLNNISKATKLQKVVSAVTALGFVLQPVAALASEITRLDNGAEVKFNNGVGDVWAGTIVNDVAMNVFQKFDVSANDIANMYFKKKDGATEASNLVNLVFSQINVKGTVNAIHNSKIGGNLFFLSSDGLAVSGSGVINAGSLTVMTPTPEHLVQAGLASWADKEGGKINAAFGGSKDVDALQKVYLDVNWKAIEAMNIPINKMGNITVKGRINTTNGIKFKAAHINISKDANSNISPVLQSGILDFSSMVNTTDTQGNPVNANIQNLTAAPAIDGSGDIVLSAVAGSVNYNDDKFAVKGVTGYNAVQADVTVGEGAQIIAHKQGEKQGNVTITAEASVGKGQGSLFDIKSKLDDISPDDLIGTMAKTVATVDINGKVEGEKIDIQANAENKYVNGSISNMNNFAGSLIKGFIPLDSDVNYVVMENKAEVTIGEKAQLIAHAQDKLATVEKDGEITVKGAALSITANANMKASAGSAAAATKLSLKKGLMKKNGNDLGQLVPNAGVTYLETDNQANVSIKGSVQSAGGSNIAAKAEIEAEAAAAADSPSPISKLESNNFVNAAVTVADIKNSAQVDIASAVEAADALRVDAKSKGSYTTSAAVNAGETSMANTAINITDVNSSAKVNIKGKLQAKNIDIAAQNEVENDFSANNSTGLSKIAAKMATKKLTAIGGLLGQAKKKSLKAPKGLEKLGEMFTAGVSVGVINEMNKADVTIGKNAVIKATGTGENEGGLNIAANTNLAGSYVNVSGKSSNYKDKTDQQVMVNASVLVSNMDSSANVVIEAGEKGDGQHAVLQGKGISVNANSKFTYARPQKMFADLKDLLNDIKSAYEADKAVLDAVKKLLQINQTDGENYFKNPSDAGAMEFFGNLQELADLVNGSAVDANMESIKAVTSLPGAILAFVDGSKYANFYVASSTAGRDGSTGGKSATLAAAGAVNVNQLANNAQVIVGRNAVIKAVGGDVLLGAKAVQQDVTLNGKMKYVVPGVSSAGGGVVAVGGNVGVHHSDVNSVVAVAGGAELAGENINIDAENEVQHIAATYGGGKGGSIGVSGMAAYMEGTSDSIAAVDDKAKLKAKNKLAVEAKNATNIQNIIAEFAKAGGSAAGASVGYVDYKVNNIAAVANIDKAAMRAADAEVSDLNTLLNGKLKREALQLGVDDKAENQGDKIEYADLTEQLGNDAAGEAGSITAKNVEVNAATTGTIDNITVAGSITGGKTDFGSNQLKLPVNITGAGSASVNIVSGNTAALLEDTAITITATTDEKSKGQGAVNVAASDDSMIGAYSGAAALKKQSLTAGNRPGAALAGAVAYNKVENGVIAQLKNVEITNAKSISNEARKEGAQIAAGLAAELNTSITSGNMSSVNGAANASANEISNKVHAVLQNVTISAARGDKTDIVNVAQDKDIQIAGGITAQYAKSGGLGVGLAASYQAVTNDIQSKIIDSQLANIGKLQAYAASQLVQVGTAVSIGVQQGQEANGVEGAVAVNNLTNNVGVEISGSTINADSVDAKAFDGSIESTLAGAANTPNTQNTDNTNTTSNTENKHLAGLKAAGFDVDGQDATDDVNGVERDEDGNVKTSQGSDVDVDDSKLGTTTKDENDEDKGEDGKEVKDFTANNKGNLIITGATSAAVNLSLQGKATLGAAASTNDIKNNFTTKISGGTLTAGEVKAEAKSDTLMIGLAAGVAASKGQQGVGLAGSASVMQLANKTTATIEKATINAAQTSVKAATSSRLINVTGQVSATKGKVAAGLTTATNVLDNTTGAYIYGATLKGKDDSSAADVEVTAENKSDAYAVAVGVAASTNQSGGAANGAVAVNKGVNNTEAIIDAADNTRTTINKAGKINVSALGETKMKAISGGVTVSKGYAGVGGAVSYNQIGEDNKKQRVTAQVNHTDITTAAASGINVASTDKSELIAMAAGLAATTGQTGAAAQGSAATTMLHKNNEASMTDTNIDESAGGKNAQLTLKAESVARVLTSADAAALTKGNAAGSAAVAVTNSKADTQAFIKGGSMNLKSGRVQAASDVKLINIGIAAAGTTGQGGSLGGNVAVNNIANDTLASVSGATITAAGSLGVLADSKEQIKNYVGALAATVGQGYAAGGLSTAVNVISGTTSATVSNSIITASGNDDGVNVQQYAKDKEDKLNLTGFVVNADSAHEIDNVVMTAGAAVTAEAAVAASGTVTVNNINGSTVAGIESTNVNSGNSDSIADVSVRANDNTKINSHVGSAAVAASANAGVSVGEASDSNVMNREVTAKIVGDSSKNMVNADKLTVNAFNRHDILSNAIGIAGAGGAYAGVGVSGTTSVLKTTAKTTAQISNINSTNNGLTINADHVNKVQMFGNSAAVSGAIGGASVGTAIAVLNDGSKTETKLSGSEIKHYTDGSAADAITAQNDTDILSEAANIAVSASIGAGVSGVITVNNMDNAVYTTIDNSTIGEENGNKAKSITAKANNKLKTEFASGAGNGGFVAAGVGVGINTIDTSVVTDVSKSSLYATDVTLLADEERKIAQTYASAGVGGVGFNATVLVTNIGTTVSDKYGVDKTDAVNEKGEDANDKQFMSEGDKVDISNAYTSAGKAIDNQNSVVGSDKKNTVDALGSSFGKNNVLGSSSSVKDADGNVINLTTSSGLTNDALKSGATVGRGGIAEAKGVKVNVNGSTIKASDKADIKADATTDANITVGSGTAAEVAVGATVGILNVKRNSGVNIIDSRVTANNIDVKSNQDGTSAVKVYQGGVSGTALNVVYSGVHLTGQNDITLKGATLAGANGVTVATGDTSTAKLETIGVSGALTSSANIFVVDGRNESESTITVDKYDNNKNSELTSTNGKVTVEAKHGEDNKDKPTMEAEITPVAVAGMASGLGFNAKVEDNSKTTVSVGDNQKFTGKTIDIKAENNSVNKVSSVTVNAALGAAIGATGVQAKGNAGSELKVGNNNTFTADTVNLGAKANVINDAKITAVGAGFGSFMVNWATASGGTDVKVDVVDNTYNANIINIIGESVIDQHANATGAIAGMYTSGTNLAKVDSKEKVEVKAGGNNANDSNAAKNKVNITAEGLIKQNAESNGYGGAYVDVSPAAAITKSNITSTIKATVTGNWNAKTMNVNALHDNQVKLDTDALKAAVVGLSGVWAFSDVENTTSVELNSAKITTEGDVAIEARNDINYENKVQGGGYGAVAANAMEAKDTFKLRSNVDLKNSSITGKGKVDIAAITGSGTNAESKPNSTITKNVTLKSAGLVAGSLAFSKDDYTVDNKITVGKGSAITTAGNSLNKEKNNISLIAVDMVGYSDVATANTEGGAVGAASTKLNAEFERNNTITVNGKLDSNYDAELNAGGNSVMNVTLKSNAYNKTAAPIVAYPGLDYSMTQNNTVAIGSNGDNNTVQTARNINIIADAGKTTIAAETKSWKWTDGGETGTGSISSTADGTQDEHYKLNNGVVVDGKLLAGKNSKLDITFDDGDTDVSESWDAQLKKLLEEAFNKYNDVKKAYDANETVQEIQTAEKNLANAKAAKETAEIIVRDLNNSKTDVDKKQTALADSAGAIYNQLVSDNVIDAGTVKDKEAFIGLSDSEIRSKMQGKYTEADIKNFLDKKSAYNTAKEALKSKASEANNSLFKDNNDIGKCIVNDDTTGNYKVNASVDTYIENLNNSISSSKDTESYKNAQQALDKALADYNEKLQKAADVKSINEAMNDKPDNYINTGVSDWYQKENGGTPIGELGFMDYAASLTKRLTELEGLIQEYTGSKAEANYKSELARVQQELIALGLGHFEVKDGKATSIFVVEDDASTVPTISLKNIQVTGGNIDITGNKLSGSGTMTAVGNPEINITNNSKYYLRVNDIKVDSEGGNVRFNDKAVAKNIGLTVNDSPSKLVGGNNATITITSTAAKAKSNEIFTPDVGIFGTINNPFGKVKIKNNNNSIYVAAKVEGEQAGGSIKARTIELTAGGSITQGYNDGIVNISGTPDYGADAGIVAKIQEKLIESLGSNKDKLGVYRTAFETRADLVQFIESITTIEGMNHAKAEEIADILLNNTEKKQAGMYAAGAIYINAASINVNGTIQSGYDTYKLDVDNSKLNILLNKSYTGTADKDFMTNEWLVTEGTAGAVYDEASGKYVYNVNAWYNPSTGEIFTDDIDQSGGGRIYLTGAIASTGGGKLVALDGGADVTVKNTTDAALKLGVINVDKVDGMITVVDTTKKEGNGYKTTIFTRDKTTNGKATYDTTDGQMYIWTTGTSNQVITNYKAEYDSKWFGLDKDRWQDQVDQLDKVQEGDSITKDNKPTSPGSLIGSVTDDGEYKNVTGSFDNKSYKDNNGKDKSIYQIIFERSAKYKQATNDQGQKLYLDKDGKITTVGEGNTPYYLKDKDGNYLYDASKSDPVTTKKKKLLGIWGSHVTTRWTETVGVLTSYNFGLKADKDINVEFIGNVNGGTVDINSKNNIKLAGDIRANDVTITSTNGSILADSFGDALNQKTIFSDNLTLDAGKNIELVQQSVNQALSITAKAGQNISINTLAGINTGDVYLTNVSAGGDVTLDIQGKVLKGSRPAASTQILRSADSNAVANETATITAGGKLIIKAAGGIGAEGNEHIIRAGDYASLLAESGDIWAKQEGNDAMKLKQVEAKNGDVHLEAAGGFVDALDENQQNNATQNERLEEWKKQGILSDASMKEQQEAKYKEQVDNLEAQAKSTGVLGDGFENADALKTAGDKLIKAGKDLTEAVQSEYNAYYAARKEMYSKQAALNEAISAKNNGDTSKYEGALSEYNTAFAKYAQAKKTYDDAKATQIKAHMDKNTYAQGKEGAVSQWLANYEELTHEATAAGEKKLDKYGWNQNQLLYALQDSIINPAAGSVSDVTEANIIGNNIFLKTDAGDVGRVLDDQAFTIEMSELETLFKDGKQNVDAKLLEKMNKLAGARADDVNWGTRQIEVKRLTPVSVKLNNDGKVSIDAPNANNIYLIAKDSKLTMDKVISKGNVRLTGQEGINIDTIIGSNISLEGGKGDIKYGRENSILVGLIGNDGKINANAAGNILLKQLIDNDKNTTGKALQSNMVLGSLAAKNITINATGNIVSGMDKISGGEASGISYINASEKLTLKTTEGSVGTADSGLRVKNSGGVVEIDAQNGAYLEAKGDGTLVLGKITTGSNASDDFVVNSEGSLSVGREADAANNVTAVEGSIIAGGTGDAKADVKITTANDLTFSGKVRANELTAQSYAGDITQTTKKTTDNIEAEKMLVSAIAGNINLANEHNLIKNISILGVGGSLNLVVSKADGLDLNLGSYDNALSNNYGGDFRIKNNAGDINVKAANTNIYGDIELNAKKDITVKRADGDTTSKLELNTNKLNDDNSNEAMLQPNGNIKLTAETGSVTSNGTLNANSNGAEGAQADVIISAQEKVEGNGKIESINGSIGIAAGSDINLAEVIANNGKADIKSKHGDIYLCKVNGKDIILVTKDSSKKIEARDVTAGSLTVNGNNVNVGLNYDADVRNDGYVDIIFAGSDGSSMIDDITLNIDAGEIGKGAVIKKLWTKNAKVSLAQGSLNIEKLAVENKAHFDVNGMTTSVWGVPPKRDGSDSSYWFNVAAWKQGGDWMNLLFSEKQGIQRSNGVLLDLHNYFYVYGQRFTAVDHLNQLLAENKADEYDINFNPEVVRYFHYDLYDFEQELDENAAPEEVVVEA